MGSFGLVFGLFWIIWLGFMVLNLAGLVFWIFMLVDVLKRKNWQDQNDKVLWILVVILTNWVGAAIYYYVIRKKLGPADASIPPA